MSTIIRGTKSATGTVNFGASTKAKSAEVNTDFNTIYDDYNGGISNENIDASAGIDASKLDLSVIQQNIVLTGDVTQTGDLALTGAVVVTGSIDVGTLTADSLQLTGATVITAILDEDDMASNSAVAIPTQQSVKAYVDASAGGATITSGTFTSGTLVAGILTVTHNLGLTTPFVTDITFVNGSSQICFPSSITCATNSLTADFLSYGTLTGTYGWQIIS